MSILFRTFVMSKETNNAKVKLRPPTAGQNGNNMKNYKAFESLINDLIARDEKIYSSYPEKGETYAWGWLLKDEEDHMYKIGSRFVEQFYCPEEIIQISKVCGLSCYLTIATNEQGNNCIAICCF